MGIRPLTLEEKKGLLQRLLDDARNNIQGAMRLLPMGSTVADELQTAKDIVSRARDDVDELDFEDDADDA